MASCDGCVYLQQGEHGRRLCSAMPKQFVRREQWVESGNPMLGETRVVRDSWEWPPADARCVHYRDSDGRYQTTTDRRPRP